MGLLNAPRRSKENNCFGFPILLVIPSVLEAAGGSLLRSVYFESNQNVFPKVGGNTLSSSPAKNRMKDRMQKV